MPVRRVTLGEAGELVRQNVRYYREKKDLTQAALADKAGLPSQSITEIENGARRVNVDDLVAISSALHISVLRLIGQK